MVGAGGVGSAVGPIAQRRSFFEHMVFADYDLARAESVAEQLGEPDRFGAAQIDASDSAAIVALAQETNADAILNAVDPRFNPPIFAAALEARCTYLDMAMTLSEPHPERPYEETGVKLGDLQFAAEEYWQTAGLLALVGVGVEPGLSDVFARYAADHLFSEIDEAGVRDGSNIVVEGYEFAPSFSIWTTIEECLNPPVIWEQRARLVHDRAVLRARGVRLPGRHRPRRVRERRARGGAADPALGRLQRVTFKYGLGEEFIDVLRTLHKLGLDSKEPVSVRGVEVAPRDVVAASLPDPATLGDRMSGKTCAGTFVTGTGKDGEPRATYLYHVADNEDTMREYGSQAVVWQTALNPVIALELLATGAWKGTGVLGPEAFDAVPFLDLLAEYDRPFGVSERA